MASSNQGSNQGSKQSSDQSSSKQSGSQGSSQSGDTSNRGFASMDPDRQREIAAEGGRAAHAAGTAHEFTSEEARKAGSMSHKNDGNQQSGSRSGSRSGSDEDESSGSRSGSKGSTQGSSQGSTGTRGGTPEQHAEAGRQSHKNDRT
ncbi:KGG domain-containing protein [Pseudoduganella aquatica]|uniref:KGG domain-containing protein n=1 Tax=Pseudoduganella aquatica TaxID=2660641 RepID=UPI001E50E9E2|nr:KGG domain-containing protein [Pseudoduganella aquatica]